MTNKENNTSLEKTVETQNETQNETVETTLKEVDEASVKEDNSVTDLEDDSDVNIEEILEETAVETVIETVEKPATEESEDTPRKDKKESAEEKIATDKEKVLKFSLHDLVWITIGLVIGILLSYFIFNVTLSSAINQLAVNVGNSSSISLDNVNSGTGVSTYNNPHSILDNEADMEDAKALINNYIKGMLTGSTYSQVMVGEDQYVYYMYNSNGEIFTQDASGAYTEVFLTNGKVLKFNTEENVLSIGGDIDIASILNNSVKAIGNKNVTLYEMDLTESDVKGREFRVDLVGEDAVKLLYTSHGNDFAKEMVDSIKSTIENWDPHIIMTFFIGENYEDSYCYCLYVINNGEYTNWLFQGYDAVDDWTLSEDWYSYDAEKDSDGKVYSELITNLVEDIDKVMLSYADSKGWLEDNTESTEKETKDSAN